MRSLYGRLFTYRQREKLRPLEDFLSEALADLLNRLPDGGARRIVTLLLGTTEIPVGLARLWTTNAAKHWSTQRRIEGGKIVDLVLEVGGNPVLVIENKIAAGFQEHGPALDATTEEPSQHQLATYCRWMASRATEDWSGAVILLTHWTPAPDDFLTSVAAFPCEIRNSVRWAELARALSRLAHSEVPSGSVWEALIDEFLAFLKEHAMTEDLMNSSDLAALNVFLSSAARVEATVNHVWNGILPILRPYFQQTSQPIRYNRQYACVWAFRYMKHPLFSSNNGFFAWGIRFPDILENKSDAATAPNRSPHVFIEISDAKPVKIKLPSDTWLEQSDDNVWIAARPVHTFPIDPDDFAAETLSWAEVRAKELSTALATHQ